MVIFQNDLQAFHAADTPETVVDSTVKGDVHLVGQGFPGFVVILIGETDDSVQVKNNGIKLHGARLLSISDSPCRRRDPRG